MRPSCWCKNGVRNSYNQCPCVCNYGWSGAACDQPSCFGIPSAETDKVCSGLGSCTAPDTCICNYGWTGPNCATSNGTQAIVEIVSARGTTYKYPGTTCLDIYIINPNATSGLYWIQPGNVTFQA